MSAFLCSNTHTAVIAMLAHAPGIVSIEQLRDTARILRQLNDAALRARYGDSPNPMSRQELCAAFLAAGEWLRDASHADMANAVKCFAYQCAEDIPADYPGLAILGSVQNRVYALPDAGGNSGVWSI